MKTQPHEIIKPSKASSATTPIPLTSYVIRTIEILKSVIISIEIPKEAVWPLIGGVILTAVIFVMIVVGNITNGLNQPLYQFPGFFANKVELTADYHRQAILSDYLKTMTQIMLEKNPRLVQDKLSIFRGMTQATLQELDPGRQRYVVLFLQDANLLQVSSRHQAPLLFGANLVGANLQGINLKSANLQGTNLTRADLRGTDLRGANLANANLTNSCYNNSTVFDKKFLPNKLGMRELTNSQKCS
ncbi:MAG: pentapeptide repeat-containing protein [Gloeotrichia echinulata GP01]